MEDVVVRIRGHEVPTDFLILDMGEDDDVHLILGRPFLYATSTIIYKRKSIFTFLEKRYDATSSTTYPMKHPRRTEVKDAALKAKEDKLSRIERPIMKKKLSTLSQKRKERNLKTVNHRK